MAYVRKHIRGVIYVLAALVAAAVYLSAALALTGSLRTIRIEEWYGYIAVTLLAAALLPTPLYRVFPTFPGKQVYTHARRALGVSTFCFATAHAAVAFFGLLQGVRGLPFLDSFYLTNLSLSLFALVILAAMAITSNDISFQLLGPWWKRLHRFVYIVAAIVLFHIVRIGSHLTDPGRTFGLIFLALVALFIFLELLRVDGYLAARFGYPKRVNVIFGMGLVGIVVLYLLVTGNGSFHHHHGTAIGTIITLFV